MTRNEVTNWILVNYTATSLYSVIADGNLRKTNVGKEEWKSLINGASLQKYCNKEGFNVKCHRSKSRIGIVSNDQDDCASCDSGVGFGIEIVSKDTELRWSSGNVQLTRTTRKLKTFGYIFVQWTALKSKWLIKDFKVDLHNRISSVASPTIWSRYANIYSWLIVKTINFVKKWIKIILWNLHSGTRLSGCMATSLNSITYIRVHVPL